MGERRRRGWGGRTAGRLGWVGVALASVATAAAASVSAGSVCTHAPATWQPPPLVLPPAGVAAGGSAGTAEGEDSIVLVWLEGEVTERDGGREWRQLLRSEVVPPLPIAPVRGGSRLRCATGSPAADCDVRVAHARLLNATAFEVHFSLPTTMPDATGPAFGTNSSASWLAIREHGCAALVGAWLHPAALEVACRDGGGDGGGDGDAPEAPATEAAQPTVAASVMEATQGAVWDASAVAAAHDAVTAAIAEAVAPPPAVQVYSEVPGVMRVRRCVWTARLSRWSRMHAQCAAVLRGEHSADAFPAVCSIDPDSGAACTDATRDGAAPDPSTITFRDCARDAPGAVAIRAPRRPSPDARNASAQQPVSALPTPAYRFAGVLASGPFAAGAIPDGSLPPGARNGSGWSMCTWLWLVEGAGDCADGADVAATGGCPRGLEPAAGGGAYRALFFKGHGGADQHRTPSAWLEPDADVISLRVSRSAPDVDFDVTARSNRPLPRRVWTHLCFSFANGTASGGSGGDAFAVAIYMDGALDVIHRWPHPVVISRNDGPLALGANNGFAGARALLSEFSVFDGVLAPSEVSDLYAASAPTYSRASSSHPVRGDEDASWGLLRWGVVRATAALAAAATSAGIGTPAGLAAEAALAAGRNATTTEWMADATSVGGLAVTVAASAPRLVAALAVLRGCRTSMGMPPPPEVAEPPPADTCLDDALADTCVAPLATPQRQHPEYDAMVDMLVAAEGAALDGSGSRAATALVADWLAYPGRDGCDVWPSDVTGLTAARDATTTWWRAASLNARSAWGALMGAHAALPAAFEPDSGATWGRQAQRASRLRALAAARRDGTALYDLAVALLTRMAAPPIPGGPGVGMADDAVAVGYLHVAAAGGEAFALPLLARAYNSTGVRGLHTSFILPGAPDAGEPSCPASLRRLLQSPAGAGGRDGDDEARGWRGYTEAGCPHPGAPVDVVTAAAYWSAAATAAAEYFRRPAGQPSHEFVRLTPDSADSGGVEVGQRGEDDNAHQLTLERAERGDVDAMVTAGNLYYWGGGGMAVDRGAAYRWWNAAADAGNAGAAAAAGGMAVTGQGVPRDMARGLTLYRQAAAANDTRALNGLGYAYYHGADDLPANATAAYEYFARAAAQQRDADSLINAAACLSAGTGTRRNMTAAVAHWVVAAERFDSFTGGLEAGRAFLAGWRAPACTAGDGGSEEACVEVVTPPDVHRAAALLSRVAHAMGPWADLSRRGFRRYLARDYPGALGRFLAAALHGYTVGAANAGYLLLRRLAALPLPGAPSVAAGMSLFRACLDAGETDVAVSAADYALAAAGHGLGPAGGIDPALSPAAAAAATAAAGTWYALACTATNSAHGCFSLAALLEAGIGGRRADAAAAQMYYERAVALAPTGVMQAPARIALTRLRAAAWLADAMSVPWVGTAVSAASVAAVAAERASRRLLAAGSSQPVLAALASLYVFLQTVRWARRCGAAARGAVRGAGPERAGPQPPPAAPAAA